MKLILFFVKFTYERSPCAKGLSKNDSSLPENGVGVSAKKCQQVMGEAGTFFLARGRVLVFKKTTASG